MGDDKMAKRQSSKGPRRRGEFHELAERDRLSRARLAEETGRERERLKPARVTNYAITTVAWGPMELRTGLRRMDLRTLQTAVWAKRIRSAAKSWGAFPGAGIIRREPNLQSGVGMDIARKIFLRAMDKDLTADQIRELLDDAVDALGPFYYKETERLGPSLELIAFFRTLARFYDGTRWAPPRNWATASEAPLHSAPKPQAKVTQTLPTPTLKTLKESLAILRNSTDTTRFSAGEVVAMYGLGEVSAPRFARSTRYVARGGPPQPHQLPRPASANQGRTGGRFGSTASWSRDEVLAAVKGLLARLEDRTGSPF